MITAIDTNVLLDVFLPDPEFGETSFQLLRDAYDQGALVVSEIVYAELVPQFEGKALLDETLAKMNIAFSSMDQRVAFLAGERWGHYRKSGGKRKRIITDFLIGAHAKLHADRLLTRDRGFYRQYFKELRLISST
ncbi:MAG: PIN domain-containing protein [Armatimonadetes bacterium]|nr:PIN domain-containing protein [Armatimonadota bacterium]